MTAGTTRRSGQNLVEFAMVTVLLLAIVLGIVEFGRVWMTFQVVTNASREGARLGSLPAGFTTTGDVTSRVNNYLTSANLDTGRATVNVTGVNGSTGTDVVVTVGYAVDLMFLGPVLTLIDSSSTMPGSIQLQARATMRNE